ncbi:MAG: pyridoxamine 5'-phosphate oxidase family protein, partial [Desulfobacula sp.]|nr:pyridoxamine 5'-phosphate oxidase family protein [Desulfobacula sp.]
MEEEIKKKTARLIDHTRVMTLAVTKEGVPWSSPVYFVFHGSQFYFFSNENSRHVQYAMGNKPVSVSLFHDADKIDEIFGFQMAGRVTAVSD